MTISLMRYVGARSEGVGCSGCLHRPKTPIQRRRRRRWRSSKSVVALSAGVTVTVLLLVLLDVGVPCFGFRNTVHPGVRAATQPPRLSGATSWKRCRPSRHCTSSNVVGDHRKDPSSGPTGAAGATVHTLLIDNYDSYTYNLFQLLAVVNGQAPFVVSNDDDDGDLW